MHNKAWIVDGRLMIGGGRNVGDEYFGAASQFNFRDLNLAVGGEATRTALAVFDLYWTHHRVRSIEQVAVSHPLDGGLDALRGTLDGVATSGSAQAYLQRLRVFPNLAELLGDKRILLNTEMGTFVRHPVLAGELC